MAKKKDQNEDPEEEKKNQFDDDEDFGLPDLDYDELEEEADEELGESVFGEDEPDLEETTIEKEEEVPEVVAETPDQPEPDEFDSEMDVDMDVDMDEDWEKELEDELEEDLKSGDFEEVENFYEEESFDEFKEEIEQEAVGASVFGSDEEDAPAMEEDAPQESKDDFYAAPEEIKEEESTTEFKPQYSEYLDENQNSGKGKFARTVLIGAALFMVVGGILFFLWDGTGVGSEETEVAAVEEETPEPVAEETTSETASEEAAVIEEAVVEEPVVEKTATPVAANPVDAGTISTLTERTGKSYLIIASFFDGDMAQDYAKELSDEGKSPFVIPPFKEHRYYRVAIAEYDNFTDAKSGIESYKAEFEVDVWPLRY